MQKWCLSFAAVAASWRTVVAGDLVTLLSTDCFPVRPKAEIPQGPQAQSTAWTCRSFRNGWPQAGPMWVMLIIKESVQGTKVAGKEHPWISMIFLQRFFALPHLLCQASAFSCTEFWVNILECVSMELLREKQPSWQRHPSPQTSLEGLIFNVSFVWRGKSSLGFLTPNLEFRFNRQNQQIKYKEPLFQGKQLIWKAQSAVRPQDSSV